jgi:hypothetical protein
MCEFVIDASCTAICPRKIFGTRCGSDKGNVEELSLSMLENGAMRMRKEE